MEKMGWSEGQGLGKNKDGQTDCLQIKRRGEFLGVKNVNSIDSWGIRLKFHKTGMY
jgi:hypothetical protein